MVVLAFQVGLKCYKNILDFKVFTEIYWYLLKQALYFSWFGLKEDEWFKWKSKIPSLIDKHKNLNYKQ